MFPKSCELPNKFIAKEKFYGHGDFSGKLKSAMTTDIVKISATHKLSALTLNIEAGKVFPEIMVLRVLLKTKDYEPKLLDIMDKSIRAAFVLFVLEYEGSMQASIAYKDRSGDNIIITKRWNSSWTNDLLFDLEGRNIDAIYEALIRQISNGKLLDSQELNLKEKVNKAISTESKEKQIKQLEIKISKEPQFKRKLELKEKIKQLKAQL